MSSVASHREPAGTRSADPSTLLNGLRGTCYETAVETRSFAEGCEQGGAEAVAELPVAGQAAGHLKQMDGQVRQVSLGYDSEA